MHMYLSPHADDAALSCGGQIASLTRRREKVVIHTLMIAEPPQAAFDNPLVQHFHALWKLGGDVVAVRRGEDHAAAHVLGAEIVFGRFLEAGYRTDAGGAPLYTTIEQLLGAIHPDDPLRDVFDSSSVAAFRHELGVSAGDTLHAPLGVGGHVDHRVVRDLARALAREYPDVRVVFYEEYPYASWNADMVSSALGELALPVERVLHRLDAWAMLRRIRAIACYRSQLKMIWPRGMIGMALRTWQFMRRVGGEIEWRIA